MGVERNIKTAVKAYTYSANGGYAPSALNLEVLYVDGELVSRDYELAKQWLAVGAYLGDANSQINLASMYLNGEGVTRDPLRAQMWLIIAAEKGDAQSIKDRDKIASGLNAELTEAVKGLVNACVANNYKGC